MNKSSATCGDLCCSSPHPLCRFADFGHGGDGAVPHERRPLLAGGVDAPGASGLGPGVG